jgi:hypothetical protein
VVKAICRMPMCATTDSGIYLIDLHKPHDSRQLDGVSNPASEA